MIEVVQRALSRSFGDADVVGLRRLSGGANMETWAFTLDRDDGAIDLILRRIPTPDSAAVLLPEELVGEMLIEREADLLCLASEHQVPVPKVHRVLVPKDDLGRGYVMSCERGEALPRRLLSDARYAQARDALPRQCGMAMARIHAIPESRVPADVPRRHLLQQLQYFQSRLDQFGNLSPVHQLGLNWLRDHLPEDRALALVHGDFRNGNLLVDENGLSSVLDWELAHVGHPYEDLGYFCANVWRFGVYDKPAGGFGRYEDLLDGYQSVAGHAPTISELKYWELVAALNWGLVTQTMATIYQSGLDHRLERAAVARRLSESEIDILLLLDEWEG